MTQTTTNKIGAFDYDKMMVALKDGKLTTIHESRPARMVVDSHGNPKTILPDYVSPDAWGRYVGKHDRVVRTRVLITVRTEETGKPVPQLVPRTMSRKAGHDAFPAAL